MDKIKKAIDKEIKEAKRELGLLTFKKRNSTNETDKWYYIGAMKQLREKITTLCYLWSICE